MVSVHEATAIIQNNLWQPSSEQVKLLDSINRVMAEDIMADRDFPPFDRVTMDGIAIVFETFRSGTARFKIEGLQAAGMPQKELKSADSCLEVMTGAMLPLGCDTVVRYEDVKIQDGNAEIICSTINKGDSIHRQGNDAVKNTIVVQADTVISAAEIPLMASVGKSFAKVRSLPRTALISTGDELVDLTVTPEAHQIRKSNVYALAGGLKKFSITPDFFHLNDDENAIQNSLTRILSDHDLIILSGGVSKGKFDMIPTMLEKHGIQKHFYQVKQRPGKPMWFGTGNKKVVFALPGNPVSTFLCYSKYIDPWIRKSLGATGPTSMAILESDFMFDLPLTYFLQVKVQNKNGKLTATPIPGGGSGDFVNLKEVDGFLELPEDGKQFKAGDAYPYISFRQ